jgi:hypothetical protein
VLADGVGIGEDRLRTAVLDGDRGSGARVNRGGRTQDEGGGDEGRA